MKLKLIIILILMGQMLRAQNSDEWFRQKKTKRKYLLEQIEALKVLLKYTEEGYAIATKGVNTIRDIKKGDFDLHHGFFSSLKAVNPKIERWGKIADIMIYQMSIMNKARKCLSGVRQSSQFTNEEVEYCQHVIDNLLNECITGIDDILAVMENDELQMRDNERLDQVERIYSSFQNHFAFISSFSNEIGMLAVQREHATDEIYHFRIINGIE